MLIGKGVVENLSGIPLIDIELPLFEKLHKITKRIFDFILSAVLIFLTFPVHVCYLLTGRVDEKKVWFARHSNGCMIKDIHVPAVSSNQSIARR